MLETSGINTLLQTLFLLFIGNFGALAAQSITSCKIKYIITHNIYIQHLLFFIIIFTTNSFVTKHKSLYSTSIKSIILYISFIMLMKNYYVFLIITVILLFINKLILQKIDYLTTKNKKPTSNIKHEIERLKSYSQILTVISVGILIIGFMYYLYLKKKEYGKKFNILTFIMGTQKCKSEN